MKYLCAEENRRAAVRAYSTPNAGRRHLNGIDYLEVEPGRLRLRFLKPLDTPAEIKPAKISIKGGERITQVGVVNIQKVAADELAVKVDQFGDFSIYTLTLQQPWEQNWFDERLLSVDFSFQVDCLDGDCDPPPPPPPATLDTDGIDYLAKDYASLRRLMLERLARTAPGWQARSAADQGMALVEMLAYVGDYLSYQQDATAAEAYLDTARRRASVRRHARLVDYRMHDGCNARTWVQVQVKKDVDLPEGAEFVTHLPGAGVLLQPDDAARQSALGAGRAESFASLEAARLHADHNQLDFYTWGEQDCLLPAGATQAVLVGKLQQLAPGAVLVLVELPLRQGRSHVVRLTAIRSLEDPLGASVFGTRRGPGDSGGAGDPLALTEVTWGEGDALPFDLPIRGTRDAAAVALGNIILADHGWWVEDRLPPVPAPRPSLPRRDGDGTQALPVLHYQPRLALPGLICREEWLGPSGPAAGDLAQDPRRALPQLFLTDAAGQDWSPRHDLLESDGEDPGFVAELENDGTLTLRFGDGVYGRQPAEGQSYTVRARTGGGQSGAIGAWSLAHLVTSDSNLVKAVIRIANPLPAWGGQEPESLSEVRRRAPYAYQVSERAVRPEDYAARALLHPEVQGAVAQERWTGSWYTIFLAVDRKGGKALDEQFKTSLVRLLDLYRMAGHDLEICEPVSVALRLELTACLNPGAARPLALAELRRRLLPGRAHGASRGFFDPDRFTFGQPVFLSAIYAALDGTPGVASVNITRFERTDSPGPGALASGAINPDMREIIRLDGDPNNPEHGILRLNLEGGL